MEKELKILILEDSPDNADLIQHQLLEAKIKLEVIVVSTKEEFSNALENFVPDIIISDHPLPHLNSLEALKILKIRKFKVPFILVTSSVSQEFIVQIMKEGANDYILKDQLGNLPGAILNALEKHKLEADGQKVIDGIIANETLLNKIEKLAHIGSWQHDLITDVEIWADETFRIYGYTPGQVTPSQEAFLKSIHPDDQEGVKNAIENALSGTAYTLKINYRRITATNDLRYINCELFIERNDKQQPVLITSFVQDVTAAKLAEEKLHNSQAHLLASQSIGHIGSWEILDISVNDPLSGSPLYWSDETFRIFGLDPGEINMTTTSFLKMVHPDDREAVNREFKESFEGEKIYTIDHRIIRSDLTERIIKERGEIIYDAQTGKRLKMIGTVQDITDRKRAQKELQKSEANLRTIINNTNISYILIDAGAKIISFNQTAFNEFKSETGKELVEGAPMANYISADKREALIASFKKVLNGEPLGYENSYLSKDGTTKWYNLQLSTVRDNNNNILGMIMATTDITPRKLAELEREKITVDLTSANKGLAFQNEEKGKRAAELILANKELLFQNIEKEKRAAELLIANKELAFQNEEKEKRAAELIIANKELKTAELERKKITGDLIQRNSDLEQFTYIVSHNLRAPVANIIGFSESILDEVLGENERKEVSAALYDSAQRLDEVVYDLNNILKVRSESGELKEVVNLSSIVDSIRVSSKHHIEKANGTIITDFTAINELFSLKSYIYSIFYNLISNSIKYRRADVEPVIEIKSALTIDKIIITFTDNGLGIDLSKRVDQIFGLYKRFHKHVDGKGVGLFMVKTQVETLGGKITIISSVNKGTEFKIEFEATTPSPISK